MPTFRGVDGGQILRALCGNDQISCWGTQAVPSSNVASLWLESTQPHKRPSASLDEVLVLLSPRYGLRYGPKSEGSLSVQVLFSLTTSFAGQQCSSRSVALMEALLGFFPQA